MQVNDRCILSSYQNIDSVFTHQVVLMSVSTCLDWWYSWAQCSACHFSEHTSLIQSSHRCLLLTLGIVLVESRWFALILLKLDYCNVSTICWPLVVLSVSCLVCRLAACAYQLITQRGVLHSHCDVDSYILLTVESCLVCSLLRHVCARFNLC